jgi:hypothetical protein
MNVRWYIALFDDAGDTLHDWMGLTPAIPRRPWHRHLRPGISREFHYRTAAGRRHRGLHPPGGLLCQAPALRHVPGERHTRGKLAATLECINAFADLRVRRTAPWPPEVAGEKLAEAVAADSRLDWAPPLSGSMRA